MAQVRSQTARRRGPPKGTGQGKTDLSPRQREIEALLLRGLMDKQIAHRLCLRPLTVKQHVRAVYRFRGVGSRTELMARRIAELEALVGEKA